MKALDYAGAAPLVTIPDGRYVEPRHRMEAILDALRGVQLGAYDERMLAWLVGWDDSTVRTFVGLFLRARAAGAAEAIATAKRPLPGSRPLPLLYLDEPEG